MRRFAFIFARGGSKGLKEKNIKIFLDQPLITYSIKQAINCKIFEKVFVSTDNEKIANISLLDGAEVIDRPLKLAQDNSPERLAWQHAISYAEKKYGIFDQFVSLPPTSPLRSNEDIFWLSKGLYLKDILGDRLLLKFKPFFFKGNEVL